MDPEDVHHVSAARGCRIAWNSQTRNNATPGLRQSGGHSGYKMTHLSCLDDNATLLEPETKPQEVELAHQKPSSALWFPQ